MVCRSKSWSKAIRAFCLGIILFISCAPRFSSRPAESSILPSSASISNLQGKIILLKGRFAVVDVGLNNGLKAGAKLSIFRVMGISRDAMELFIGNGFACEVYHDRSIIRIETTRYKLALGDLARLP